MYLLILKVIQALDDLYLFILVRQMNQDFNLEQLPDGIEETAEYNIQNAFQPLYHDLKDKIQKIMIVLTTQSISYEERVKKLISLCQNECCISQEKSISQTLEQKNIPILLKDVEQKKQMILSLQLELQKQKKKSKILQDESKLFNIDISNTEDADRSPKGHNSIKIQDQIQRKKAELEDIYKVERQQLQKQKSQKEKEIKLLNSSLKTQEEKITKLLVELNTRENCFNTLAIQKEELQENLNFKKLEITNLKDTINTLTKSFQDKLSQQQLENSRLTEQIHKLQEQLDKLKFTNDQKQRQIISERQQKLKFASIKGEQDKMIAVLNQKQLAQAQQIAKKEEIIKQNTKNTIPVTQMQNIFNQSKQEAQKWKKEKKKLQQQITDLVKELQEKKSIEQKLTEQSRAHLEEKQFVEHQLAEQKVILSEKQQQIAKIKERLIQVEEQKTNLKIQITQLKQQHRQELKDQLKKSMANTTEMKMQNQKALRRSQIQALQLTEQIEKEMKKSAQQQENILKLLDDLQKAQNKSNSFKRQIEVLNAKINQSNRSTVPLIDFENIIKQSTEQAQKWGTDKKKIQGENIVLKKQIAQLKEKYGNLSNQLKLLKAQDSDIESMQSMLQNEKKKVEMLTINLGQQKKIKEKLENTIKKLGNDLNKAETSLKICQQEREKLKTKLFQTEFNNKQKLQMQAKIQKLKQQKEYSITQKQTLIQQLQFQKAKSSQTIREISQEIQQCRWKLLAANGEISQLKEGKEKFDQQKTEMSQKIQKYKTYVDRIKNHPTKKHLFDFIKSYISTNPQEKLQLRQEISVYLS